MNKKIIYMAEKEYQLFPEKTVFRFTSALGFVLAEGHIFLKEIDALKEFRQKTISTEVFIYNLKKNQFERADKYEVEE